MTKQGTTHTPGPWGIEVSTNMGHTVRVVAKVGRDGIGDDICRLGDVTKPGHEANARLIAAAPELLEALETIMSYPSSAPATHLFRAESAIRAAKGSK